MPLITCPDCSREVSPTAPACPGCGRPMQAQTIERTGKAVKRVQLLFGALILAGMGLLLAKEPVGAIWMLSLGFVGLAATAGVAWWRHG